jgi:chemotaxis protein MotB
MQASLRKRGLQDDVQAQIDERGLVVSLVSRHVVFRPNVAELTPRGRQILDTLAPVLAGLPEPIEVDGHTNQVKVKPKFYPTDWELSSARAITALRHLQEQDGLPAGRLTAAAFGHTKPLVDPRTPGSQAINKRVDIVVLSQAPAETREKLSEIQNELQPHPTTTAHTTDTTETAQGDSR